MKYIPPYRIDNEQVFEWSPQHDAYVFYGTKRELGRVLYSRVVREVKDYDEKWDAHK